jgi:hypothetical protein
MTNTCLLPLLLFSALFEGIHKGRGLPIYVGGGTVLLPNLRFTHRNGDTRWLVRCALHIVLIHIASRRRNNRRKAECHGLASILVSFTSEEHIHHSSNSDIPKVMHAILITYNERKPMLGHHPLCHHPCTLWSLHRSEQLVYPREWHDRLLAAAESHS